MPATKKGPPDINCRGPEPAHHYPALRNFVTSLDPSPPRAGIEYLEKRCKNYLKFV